MGNPVGPADCGARAGAGGGVRARTVEMEGDPLADVGEVRESATYSVFVTMDTRGTDKCGVGVCGRPGGGDENGG